MKESNINHNPSKVIFEGLLKALVGGLIGYFAFFWLVKQGFSLVALPGGLLGVGGGLGKGKSMVLAITCGILALLLGFFVQWRYAPFIEDGSLGFFITHLHALSPMTLIAIGLGGLLGFWLPFHRKAQK